VIVKEVGWGITAQEVRSLFEGGAAAVDVARPGGTSWSEVERHRLGQTWRANVAATFAQWGIPTAEALCDARRVSPTVSSCSAASETESTRPSDGPRREPRRRRRPVSACRRAKYGRRDGNACIRRKSSGSLCSSRSTHARRTARHERSVASTRPRTRQSWRAPLLLSGWARTDCSYLAVLDAKPR